MVLVNGLISDFIYMLPSCPALIITKLVTFHVGEVLHLAKNPARTLDSHY